MHNSGIAPYGTAAALAGQLDLRNDQRMLYESLEEEKRADALLTNACQGRGEPRLGFSVRNQSCFILGWTAPRGLAEPLCASTNACPARYRRRLRRIEREDIAATQRREMR
jgi:hypothetical protein